MILSSLSACPVVVDLAARVVEDIQLNNGLRENTWFCGQNACSFWSLLSSKGNLWQSSTGLQNRLPKDVGHQTSKRRCEERTEATSRSVEPRRLSWWCGCSRAQEHRLPRYSYTSSKNPAPVHWQMGLEKFWCLTTMPRPLYHSSKSRDRGVIFLPRPRSWTQIIPDLTRCRTHWAAADSQATCIALSERQYSPSLKTGSSESQASLNTRKWQQCCDNSREYEVCAEVW